MSASLRILIFATAAINPLQAAHAQMSAPSIWSSLPNISAISAGNAAGVLKYCVSKQLVSVTMASQVLDGLTGKPGLVKSPEYAAGQAGQIVAGPSKPFLLGEAPGYLQSRACDLVLTRAKQFP